MVILRSYAYKLHHTDWGCFINYLGIHVTTPNEKRSKFQELMKGHMGSFVGSKRKHENKVIIIAQNENLL